jgi:hypothetical protein
MNPPTCVPGRACTTDTDCNTCSDVINPQDCGHGYHLTAWCDPNHGNVCTRSRSPCEPCTQDSDCGRVHPLDGNARNTCVDYGGGQRFCGRPCTQGCPDGFACNNENVCTRMQGCAAEPVICPEDPNPGVNCTRPAPHQVCPGESCGSPAAGRCSTNDRPGALGICIGFCTQDADCPPETPICNPRNGICIAGCAKGSCPAGQVCHADGFCDAPCAADGDCENNPKYGPDTYCNLPPPPARPPPRYYKGGMMGYRDDFSCAPLGCERNVDCVVSGIVCDKTQLPPACAPGCYEADDCLAAEVCRRGPQRQYTEQECRALPEKDPGEAELGVCCDPGCQNLELDCGFMQWCCGEDLDPNIMEPFENAANCGSPTATIARQALPGECFDMDADPWCRTCMGNDDCNMPPSAWTPGYNGNPPVQEQEFCIPIAMGVAACGITCNPDLDLAGIHTCPRLWNCGPLMHPCFQDADCNGLACIGANPGMNIPGACRCGENGTASAVCPQASIVGGVDNPRCVEKGTMALQGPPGSVPGEFYCVMGFNCTPPPLQVINMMTGETNYPAACGF